MVYEIGDIVYYLYKHDDESVIIYKATIVALFLNSSDGDTKDPNSYWIVCDNFDLKFENMAEEEAGTNLLFCRTSELFKVEEVAIENAYKILNDDDQDKH